MCTELLEPRRYQLYTEWNKLAAADRDSEQHEVHKIKISFTARVTASPILFDAFKTTFHVSGVVM